MPGATTVGDSTVIVAPENRGGTICRKVLHNELHFQITLFV